MQTELFPLALLILMQVVLGLVATYFVGRKNGVQFLFSSRGSEAALGDSLAGRLHRARANGFECITYFAPVALLLVVGDLSTPSTAAAAWIFLVARALYWAAYAGDWVPWRTVFWFIGIGCVVWMAGVGLVGMV